MNSTVKALLVAIFIVSVTVGLSSFESNQAKESGIGVDKQIMNDSLFNAYWYADKAEIRTYDLTQARYGEFHQGKMTVIFVAQPFLEKKGVKPDSYKNTRNHVPVLKMNLLKKFGTGIYPYSMMLSTFTPLNKNQGLIKASASGQEWCGQIFSQMNKRQKHYDVVSYSYFEQEGDRQFTLPEVFTEDEIWSRIRIDYNSLPVGDIDIIPGLYYTRLEQHKFEPEKAKASLDKGEEEFVYSLWYPDRDRRLVITFKSVFPYEILKWEETYADKRAPDKILTTTATLDQSMNIDYWNYNAAKHEKLRKQLGVLY